MQARNVPPLAPAAWQLGMAALLAFSCTLHAEPLLQSDTPPEDAPTAAQPEVRGEVAPLAKTDLLLIEPPTAAPQPARGLSALPAETKTPAPDADPTLHSTLKEAVRPLYNELQESGAVDTWRELKSDLGLNKNTWERPTQADAPLNAAPADGAPPVAWQDPANRPKSAAQAQLDREYDSYLLQRLIDDVQPWVLGGIGLYALGYLVKGVFNFMQWKSARRREYRAQRAHRHHTSRRRSGSGEEN